MILPSLAVIAGVVAVVTAILLCIILKKGFVKTSEIVVFIIYLTAVVCITFFPVIIDDKVEYSSNITWYNYIPFKTITSLFSDGFSVTAVIQVVGNILISVPFGFFVMMWLKKPNLLKSVIFAFGFTIAIELGQMLVGFAINNMYRNVDIDDVILNAVGAFIGYEIYKIMPDKLKNTLSPKSK